MPRLLLVLAIAAATLGSLAGAANGASLTFADRPACPGEDRYMECPGPTITYTAGGGERNDLRVEQGGGRPGVVFREATIPLSAPRGCEQVDPNAVACPTTFDARTTIAVDLGDGDDALSGGAGFFGQVLAGAGDDRLDGVSGIADGGPGADVLTAGRTFASLLGGPGEDRLAGGPSDDTLDGGEGRDRLEGGPGNDDLSGDGDGVLVPVADVLDGGDGVDDVMYTTRTEPVTVTLGAPGVGGSAGEGDELADIEGVTGGRGADRITGDGAANRLRGSAGDDRIAGGPGADVLSGSAGTDRLDAGAGDDVLDAVVDERGRPDRRSDAVRCGAGRDRVDVLDDLVEPDCERVGRDRGREDVRPTPVTRTARTIALRIPCAPSAATRGRCRGRIAVVAPGSGRVLASRSFAIAPGTRVVRLRARRRLPAGTLAIRLQRTADRRAPVLRWRIPPRR